MDCTCRIPSPPTDISGSTNISSASNQGLQRVSTVIQIVTKRTFDREHTKSQQITEVSILSRFGSLYLSAASHLPDNPTLAGISNSPGPIQPASPSGTPLPCSLRSTPLPRWRTFPLPAPDPLPCQFTHQGFGKTSSAQIRLPICP